MRYDIPIISHLIIYLYKKCYLSVFSDLSIAIHKSQLS